MSRATHAILKHHSSSMENPNRDDFPPRRNLLCSYNCDVASETNYHQPIKNPIPPAERQPLFECLRNKEFLSNFEDSKI